MGWLCRAGAWVGHFAQPTTSCPPEAKWEVPVRLARVSRRRPFTVSPSLSHRLNVLALVLVTLIVLTGGAVRLTGSGLGCSDWPECSVGHLTPALQFHGLIEFGNRLVTVVLTIAVAAAFLAAVFRRPRRRDLVYLSLGLVLGIVAQAVLGGIVVYTKLNPYLVMVHFFATMVLLANAVVLVHRSTRDYSPGSARLLIRGPCSSCTTASSPSWPWSSRPARPPPGPGRWAEAPRDSRSPSASRFRCAIWPSSTPAW